MTTQVPERMTAEDWKKIKYLHYKGETWGDPLGVAKSLVFSLENLRIASGKPLTLTCTAFTKTGHVKTSQHYIGNAADWRLIGATLMEMYLLSERFGFTGIGLYPPIMFIEDKNGKRTIERVKGRSPFMHTDVRTIPPFGIQSRWIGVPVLREGKNLGLEYITFNEENFNRYCVNY